MKQSLSPVISNTEVMPGVYLIWLECPWIASAASPWLPCLPRMDHPRAVRIVRFSTGPLHLSGLCSSLLGFALHPCAHYQPKCIRFSESREKGEQKPACGLVQLCIRATPDLCEQRGFRAIHIAFWAAIHVISGVLWIPPWGVHHLFDNAVDLC